MSGSSRTMPGSGSHPSHRTNVVPRVNSRMFSDFLDRRVRVAGTLLENRQTSLVFLASDLHRIFILVPPDGNDCRSMVVGKTYEVVGRIVSPESILVERTVELGDVDLLLINQVVTLTHDPRFSSMFPIE
ncbi:hypothetical protein C8R47DRAFT_1144564 [Mycena vitilis]|nr:hypothetical protein C8R47DRAFT_1144564 [Mycena vitilis]